MTTTCDRCGYGEPDAHDLTPAERRYAEHFLAEVYAAQGNEHRSVSPPRPVGVMLREDPHYMVCQGAIRSARRLLLAFPALAAETSANLSADAVARGVADVLTQHQLGFSGRCVDERGMACADHWTPNRRRGAGQVQQHREHLAEVLASAGLLAEGGAGRG